MSAQEWHTTKLVSRATQTLVASSNTFGLKLYIYYHTPNGQHTKTEEFWLNRNQAMKLRDLLNKTIPPQESL